MNVLIDSIILLNNGLFLSAKNFLKSGLLNASPIIFPDISSDVSDFKYPFLSSLFC